MFAPVPGAEVEDPKLRARAGSAPAIGARQPRATAPRGRPARAARARSELLNRVRCRNSGTEFRYRSSGADSQLASDVSSIEDAFHRRDRVVPRRQPIADPSRALGEPLTKSGVTHDTRECRGERGQIARRDDDPGLVGHQLGDAAGRRADDRQPTRERFGHRHPVPLVQRRQHEQIGAVVVDRQCGDVLIAESSTRSAQTVGMQLSAQPLDRRVIALQAAGTRQPPPLARNGRERPKQHVVPFSRRERRHTQKRYFERLRAQGRGRRRTSAAPRERSAVGAWLDDLDALGGDAVSRERGGSCRDR